MLDLIAELIVSSLEWTGEKKMDLILDFTELCREAVAGRPQDKVREGRIHQSMGKTRFVGSKTPTTGPAFMNVAAPQKTDLSDRLWGRIASHEIPVCNQIKTRSDETRDYVALLHKSGRAGERTRIS